MPALADLGRVVKTRPNVELITLCTDETARDAKATLSSVLGNKGAIPFLVLMDPDGKVVQDRYGTKLFPETWFIGPRGVIRARVDGARRWDDAITVDFAESLIGPTACNLSFRRGKPVGSLANLCPF